ncbi:response regulator [Candidatus Sumerlaeota bacterium]|nr:response regulator [Candidatus Sumerlaeota bacterium]
MNVVLIDNDFNLVKSLEMIMKHKGYMVQSFTDPEKGFNYLNEGGPADVLIVDYMMPNLTGDELVKKVKKFLSETCKIIMISGHTNLFGSLDLKNIGIQTFLPKPLDLGYLFQVIN